MGDYPDLPAYVLGTDKQLKTVLEENADQLIGKKVLDKFGGKPQLPYLPKVLPIHYLSKKIPETHFIFRSSP
jgi:mannose-6-phosphate isomerase class I